MIPHDTRRQRHRLGTSVRKARMAKGVSRSHSPLLAAMDSSYVSGVERGEFNVSVLKLARIARVLGTSVGSLVGAD